MESRHAIYRRERKERALMAERALWTMIRIEETSNVATGSPHDVEQLAFGRGWTACASIARDALGVERKKDG